MPKIPKNLSDSDMVSKWEKEYKKEKPVEAPSVKPGFETEFLTPELTKAIGKALLELKLKLYKEGVVDYNIKVKQEGNQVILTAVPRKIKKMEEDNY